MTRRESGDIIILGAGFGGSLLARIARAVGRRVILLEKDRHPRFAIGESSTPLANLKLSMLAERYGLDDLKPLCTYGTWKRTHPAIACGLKRGFSFFKHERGRQFDPDKDHSNELLVTANPNDERGDTHWFRSDVDAFLAASAVKAGAAYVDQCQITDIDRGPPWRLFGECDDGQIEVTAPLLIDATGRRSPIAAILNLRDSTESMATHTGGLYSHFRGVAPWSDVFVERGGSTGDHPFPCDAAALHHVIDGGWMWMLRFDNGITSAGFSLDPGLHHLGDGRSPDRIWSDLLAAYPSIARQFAGAEAVRPLTLVPRLQHRWNATAGDDWAMLPHAAGFIDPWLSPGIAHTMFAIEQLARIIAEDATHDVRARQLHAYGHSVARVFDLLDPFIATCMRSLDRFDVMAMLTMAYFAAAITSEERIRAGKDEPTDEFLLAHDARFRAIVEELCTQANIDAPASEAQFSMRAAKLLAPYNTAGLCDPNRKNMYPFTGTI